MGPSKEDIYNSEKIPDKVWAAEVLKLRYELRQREENSKWEQLALQTAKEHIEILTKKLEAVTDEDLEKRKIDSVSWRQTFAKHVQEAQENFAKISNTVENGEDEKFKDD